MPTHKAKKKGAGTGQEQGNPRGSYQTCGSRNHEGSTLPRLALEPSHGKEARWQLEDVCGLYGFKQVMSKILLSPPRNRLESRIPLQIPLQVFPRLLDMRRAGHFDEVVNQLRKMPIKPDARVWKALLGICRIHGNLEIGTVAVERLIKLEPQSSIGYVFLTENAEAPRANKFVITDGYFQRVTQALMIRLRQHEEIVAREGTGIARMSQTDLI
ncbi:hypothetical protein Tco_1005690 [Tanacetum coccineum]|uniref:Pentatricopeptide repeat-containing protein n=1 Tax=Tanacetum coccineum TaxID=301880 RepID=A0ABQ5FHC0_9ASTR